MNTCQLPPTGWKCTRAAGHTGPCAAIPDVPETATERENAALLKALRDCYMLAIRRGRGVATPENADWHHIKRFCEQAGLKPEILRADSTQESDVDKLRADLDAARGDVRRLRNAHRLNQTWSLPDSIAKLCEAVKHLRDDHDCDTHGHEGFWMALEVAEAALPDLRAALAARPDQGADSQQKGKV